jgi:hypothetical protein
MMFKRRPTETYRGWKNRVYILEMRIISGAILLLMILGYAIASHDTTPKRECLPSHYVG